MPDVPTRGNQVGGLGRVHSGGAISSLEWAGGKEPHYENRPGCTRFAALLTRCAPLRCSESRSRRFSSRPKYTSSGVRPRPVKKHKRTQDWRPACLKSLQNGPQGHTFVPWSIRPQLLGASGHARTRVIPTRWTPIAVPPTGEPPTLSLGTTAHVRQKPGARNAPRPGSARLPALLNSSGSAGWEKIPVLRKKEDRVSTSRRTPPMPRSHWTGLHRAKERTSGDAAGYRGWPGDRSGRFGPP